MEENLEGNGTLIKGFEKILLEVQRAMNRRCYEKSNETTLTEYRLRG